MLIGVSQGWLTLKYNNTNKNMRNILMDGKTLRILLINLLMVDSLILLLPQT